MKLKDQVTSLELSKRLKELGVKQESAFYYQGQKHEIENEKGYVLSFGIVFTHSEVVNVSAFTVAELGEIIPFYELHKILKGIKLWLTPYEEYFHFPDNTWYYSEADARAKMLIYLFENKLIHRDSGMEVSEV